MRRRLAWLAVIIAVAMAGGVAAAEADRAQAPLRVLFVGNSYLYTHDLPTVVQALATEAGQPLQVELIAEPDFSLADHLRRPTLARALDRHWDWIVLQQGPSALPASRRALVASVRQISGKVRGRGTRVAVLSAWPARRHAAMWRDAEDSYRVAATAAGACVMPAATAWRLALAESPDLGLYQRDGLHPTPLGTWLASLGVVHAFTGAQPLDSATWAQAARQRLGMSATALDAWALAAIAQEPRACRPG